MHISPGDTVWCKGYDDKWGMAIYVGPSNPGVTFMQHKVFSIRNNTYEHYKVIDTKLPEGATISKGIYL